MKYTLLALAVALASLSTAEAASPTVKHGSTHKASLVSARGRFGGGFRSTGFRGNSFRGGFGRFNGGFRGNYCSPSYCYPNYCSPSYCYPNYCSPSYCYPNYCSPRYCSPCR